MSSPSSATVPSSDSHWFPELDNRGIVYVLLVLGSTGMFAELVSTMFVPRMVLYLITLSAGSVGLVRRRRARQRASTATPAVLHQSHSSGVRAASRRSSGPNVRP